MSCTLVKFANDSRLYTLDFSRFSEFEDDEVISSIFAEPASVPTGLTLGEAVVSGDTTITFLVEGGTVGNIYEVSRTVQTDSGSRIEGRINIQVV